MKTLSRRWFASVVLLLLVFACGGTARPAFAQERGRATVAVEVNLRTPGARDTVTIRIADQTDRSLLGGIARQLGEKLQAPVTGHIYQSPDPREGFIDDPGIGLEFTTVVAPRGQGYLPLAPFIEVFAPHVSRLELLYIVHGPFTYRGITNYTGQGVIIEADIPSAAEARAMGMGFYGFTISMPNAETGDVNLPQYGTNTQRDGGLVWRIIGIVLLAGVLGIVFGLLAAKGLARWKAAAGITSERKRGTR